MNGIIFDIDHFAVHDGEGIRTTVYLKGCPMRCLWCHSPESQNGRVEILFVPAKCTLCLACVQACPAGCQGVDTSGGRSFRRDGCRGCGSCADSCSREALVRSGREMSVAAVVEEAAQDLPFFRNSGGGVTLTGGEVLYQADFAREILRGLKEYRIHTIVETSGFGAWRQLESLIPDTDLFYYDLKVLDPLKHKKFTSVSNDGILSNLRELSKQAPRIVLRVPLIPGYTDFPENIQVVYDLAMDLKLTQVHLLPYNPSAPAKYEWLGRAYPPGDLRRQEESYLQQLLEAAPNGLEVRIVG